MAVVGGTVSELTGGKFANGAITGAFIQLFNVEGGALKVASYVGKVWSSINTAIGLAYGGVGYIAGLMMRTNPSIKFGHNAIEFMNNPFGGNGAITFGNTITYGPDVKPSDGTLHGIGTMGNHEMQHTYQGEILGPLYIPANIVSMATGLIMDGHVHGNHAFMEVGPMNGRVF
ncbi:hypothetical protein [Sulfurimonas sp.]